jgi:hypothetical protein
MMPKKLFIPGDLLYCVLWKNTGIIDLCTQSFLGSLNPAKTLRVKEPKKSRVSRINSFFRTSTPGNTTATPIRKREENEKEHEEE